MDPLAAVVAHRYHREHRRIVERIEFDLLAARVECLAEIASMIEQADSYHWHVEIAGSLEEIRCQYAETAGV